MIFVTLQTFAIKFGSAELALEFKTAFNNGQEEMKALLAGADAPTGKAEADAAADAISALSVDAEGASAEPEAGETKDK